MKLSLTKIKSVASQIANNPAVVAEIEACDEKSHKMGVFFGVIIAPNMTLKQLCIDNNLSEDEVFNLYNSNFGLKVTINFDEL